MQIPASSSPSYVSYSGATQSSAGPAMVSFAFVANEQTVVAFSLEVQSAAAGGFYLQVDDAAPWAWDVPATTPFAWLKAGRAWAVAPGLHALKVIARQSGTQLAKVMIESGDAVWSMPIRPGPAHATPPPFPIREQPGQESPSHLATPVFLGTPH